VPPTTTEIEDLTLEQQQRLAIRKLKDLDLDYNARNATVALNGAVLQMFNHGLSSAGMFLLVGALYHKAHTRDVRRFGGLWHIVPVFAGLFVFTSMASLGLPGLNGFTGEWLIVSGTFGLPKFRLLVVLSMLGLLLTGAYILKGIRILQGPPNEEWQEYHDEHHSLEISIRETIAMAPLVALMLLTGIFPNWILPVINDSVDAIFSAFLL
jgi:NADH-quinone oxidoreductase subunit M